MHQYKDLLVRLFGVSANQGIKLGLENIHKLHAETGSPGESFQVVHIAGTNGKGSVSSKIAKGLRSKFDKVGLYTSPHISSFRERITVNGELIDEADVVRLLPPLMNLALKKGIPASFFELTSLLAFHHFAEKNVDIAVVETGLGGRLDATNILNPCLSVITSIGFDHREFLGDTLELIAQEKAGIIKPGVPVILGPSAALVPVGESSPSTVVSVLRDCVEEENRAIARKALEFFDIKEDQVRKALTTKLPCRLERIPFQDKEVILDVAHNPPALERLFHDLETEPTKIRVVCALGKMKDADSCLQILQSQACQLHLVGSPNGRCCNPKVLKEILLKQGVSEKRITVHETIADAMLSSITQAEPEQNILVCGSFFIMSEARRFLGIDEPRDPVEVSDVVNLPDKADG